MSGTIFRGQGKTKSICLLGNRWRTPAARPSSPPSLRIGRFFRARDLHCARARHADDVFKLHGSPPLSAPTWSPALLNHHIRSSVLVTERVSAPVASQDQGAVPAGGRALRLSCLISHAHAGEGPDQIAPSLAEHKSWLGP